MNTIQYHQKQRDAMERRFAILRSRAPALCSNPTEKDLETYRRIWEALVFKIDYHNQAIITLTLDEFAAKRR